MPRASVLQGTLRRRTEHRPRARRGRHPETRKRMSGAQSRRGRHLKSWLCRCSHDSRVEVGEEVDERGPKPIAPNSPRPVANMDGENTQIPGPTRATPFSTWGVRLSRWANTIEGWPNGWLNSAAGCGVTQLGHSFLTGIDPSCTSGQAAVESCSQICPATPCRPD